jgi:hypothetical protein
VTVDWDAIRTNYQARIQWEVEQGLNPVEAQPRKVTPARPRGPRPAPPPKQPEYDYKRIAALYQTGLLIQEVAELVGCHRETVTNALTALGIERRPDLGGARRQDVCQRGHDRTKQTPLPGGGCRQCKRDRERVTWHKKNAA